MEEKRLYYLFTILLSITIYLSFTNYHQVTVLANTRQTWLESQQLQTSIANTSKYTVIDLLADYTQEQLIALSETKIRDKGIGQVIDTYQIKQWLEILQIDILSHTLNEAGNKVYIRLHVETLVQDLENETQPSDGLKLAYIYTLSMDNLSDPTKYTITPAREFDWVPQTQYNTSWISRLPYVETLDEVLYKKIETEVTNWIENKQRRWCTPQDYIYLNPYKENMLAIEVEDCHIAFDTMSTKNKPIFNVLLKTKVLRKDYKTVYYNYTYQIGMINGDIMWIDFLNAHEIDK